MPTLSALSGPDFVPDGPIKNVVIFLHGLGSNGDDLLSLVPYMHDALPHTAFLAPNAPIPVPFTANGFQWFEYWDRTPNQIEQGIRAAAPLIADYIEEVEERFDIPASRIVLIGFSQGTMMSLHAGLRLIDGLGGIVGFSGALMSPETLPKEKLKKLPPVLLVHGMQDPVVPFFLSQQAELTLKTLGGVVKYVQRPMLVHSIDDVGIKEATAFAKSIFSGGK